jgi:hypothetical protein
MGDVRDLRKYEIALFLVSVDTYSFEITSTTMATPNLPTPAPAPAPTPADGLSAADKIALGTGIGIGVPACLIALVGLLYWRNHH